VCGAALRFKAEDVPPDGSSHANVNAFSSSTEVIKSSAHAHLPPAVVDACRPRSNLASTHDALDTAEPYAATSSAESSTGIVTECRVGRGLASPAASLSRAT
jgi:hypothetical protein